MRGRFGAATASTSIIPAPAVDGRASRPPPRSHHHSRDEVIRNCRTPVSNEGVLKPLVSFVAIAAYYEAATTPFLRDEVG